MTAWALALSLAAAGDLFRLELAVEESGVTTSFVADFKPGAIRIEPQGEKIFLLLTIGALSPSAGRAKASPGASVHSLEPIGQRGWGPVAQRDVGPHELIDRALSPSAGAERREATKEDSEPGASVGAALSPSATGVGPRREKEMSPHEPIEGALSPSAGRAKASPEASVGVGPHEPIEGAPPSPEAPHVTLVHRDGRFFCRMSPPQFQRLAAEGLVRPEWLFWAYSVSPDLLEDTTLERVDRRHYRVVSRKYGKVVAEYEIDPQSPPALFFQWRESYKAFFPKGEADQKRLDLYGRLPGLPLVMKERFEYLTRERSLRVVSRAPSSEEVFRLPKGFAEKTVSDLERDALKKRLLEWLRGEAPKK